MESWRSQFRSKSEQNIIFVSFPVSSDRSIFWCAKMWSICFLIVHGMEPSKAFWARKKERGNLIEWRGLTYLKQKIYSKKAIHSNAFPSRIINVQVLKVRENVMMPSWPNFYPRVQLKTQTSDKRRNLEMNPICICDFSSNGVSPSKVFLQSFQICPATFIASTTSFVEWLSRIWIYTEEGERDLDSEALTVCHIKAILVAKSNTVRPGEKAKSEEE